MTTLIGGESQAAAPASRCEKPGRGERSAGPLHSLLGSYYARGRRFLLVRPGGNTGDHLIYFGLHELTAELGLRATEISHQEFMDREAPSDAVIYIHGSGGFVPWWSERPVVALEKAITRHRGPVILGPTTFYDEDDYLARRILPLLADRTAESVHLFARDRTSYELLKRAVGDRVPTDLDHDTATHLDRARLLREADLPCDYSPRRRYTLYAIRGDKEASSVGQAHPWRFPVDPVRYCKSMREWVLLHANASHVITNRLHSAIGAAVLGVRTTLLPNSYHKNRAVWEFSLRDRGVEWRDDLQASKAAWLSRTAAALRFEELAYRFPLRHILHHLYFRTR